MLFFPVTPQDASFRGSAVGRAGEAVVPGRRRLDSLTVTLQSKHVCFKFYQKCSAVRNKPQSLQLSRLYVKRTDELVLLPYSAWRLLALLHQQGSVFEVQKLSGCKIIPSFCSEHLGNLKPLEFLHTSHIYEAFKIIAVLYFFSVLHIIESVCLAKVLLN